jgi:hypothetical protein
MVPTVWHPLVDHGVSVRRESIQEVHNSVINSIRGWLAALGDHGRRLSGSKVGDTSASLQKSRTHRRLARAGERGVGRMGKATCLSV